MSQNEKKLADYQTPECDPPPPEPFSPQDPCPTCIPDPTWILDKNWFEMPEPWLNQRLCEYNINYNIKSIPDIVIKAQRGQVFSLTDEQLDYAVEEGIGMMLNHFNKRNNTENVLSLKITHVIEYYFDPSRDIYQLLISVPAFNLDIIEEDTSSEEDEEENVEAAEDSINEITLEAQTLHEDLTRLRKTLRTFEFYYSAFNQVQQSVIHEKGSPLKTIDYNATDVLIGQFLSDLNDVLAANKYERLRSIPISSFGARAVPKKIKIYLEPTEQDPFAVKKITANSKDGCVDQVQLKNISALKKYSLLMPWLSKLDQVTNDITAQETKPWLKFTLEYYYPEMVVDYGSDLFDMEEEQKNALACVLEKELGIGRGRGLDSLVSTILSAADIFSYEQSKKQCRDIGDLKSQSDQAIKDKKAEEENQTYQEYRQAEMLKRLQKKYYNERINELKESILLTRQQEAEELQKPYVDREPSEQDALKFQLTIYKASGGSVQFGTEEIPNSELTVTQVKKLFMDEAKALARQEYNQNKDNWDFYKNSPWIHDAKQSALEQFNSDDTVVGQLKDTYKSFGDVDNFFDFIGIFGVCGVNKLSGTAIKCLSNGLTLDQFYDAVISLIFKNMSIKTFDLAFNGIPNNIRRTIEQSVEEEFGGVSVSELIGFTKEQNSSLSLDSFAGGTFKEIDNTIEIMKKHPRYSEAPEEVQKQYIWITSFSGNKWAWGEPKFDPNAIFDQKNLYYNFTRSSFLPTPYATRPPTKEEAKLQRKEKRKLRKFIRQKIKERDRADTTAAIDRFKSLFSKEGRAAIVAEAGTTVTQIETQAQMFDEDVYNAQRPAPKLTATPNLNEFYNYDERVKINDDWDKYNKKKGGDTSVMTKWMEYSIAFQIEPKYDSFVDWWNENSSKLKKDYGGWGREPTKKLLDEEITARYKENEEENKEKLKEWQDSKSDYVTDVTVAQTFTEQEELSGRESRQAIRQEAGAAAIDFMMAKRLALGTEEYEQALKDYEETNLGVKVNKLISKVFVDVVEDLLDITPTDDLWSFLKQYPIPDILLNVLEGLLRPCPNETLFFPPPSKFLNTLNVDVCDPTLQLTFPKLVVPTLDWKSQVKDRVKEALRKRLIKLYTDTVKRILNKILNLLEGVLCRVLETAGTLVSDLVNPNAESDSFYNVLDDVFCGGDRKKSKQLAKEMFGKNQELAERAANIIGGVASTREIFEAMAYPENDQRNDNVNNLIANAVNNLDPELNDILGSPSLVGIALANVASHIAPEDRERIRNLLDEDIPNLPISEAICLTDEQLREWNDLRNQLLLDKGISPEDAIAQVNRLNAMAEQALADLADVSLGLDGAGPFVGPLEGIYDPEPDAPLFGPDGRSDDDPADQPGGGIDDIYEDDEEPCSDLAREPEEIDEDEEERTRDQQERESSYFLDFIKNSYYQKGGIFNEALRDREDKGMNGHALRVSQRFLWPNWANSAEEWDNKYEGAGFALKFVMDQGGTESEDVPHIGTFPMTVGAKMREQLLENDFFVNLNNKYSRSRIGTKPIFRPSIGSPAIYLDPTRISGDQDPSNTNMSLEYLNDLTDGQTGNRRRGYFEYRINTMFHPEGDKSFGIYASITSKNSAESDYQLESSARIPIEPTEQELNIINSIGVNYKQDNYTNVRKTVFKKLLNSNLSSLLGSRDYGPLYDQCFKQVTTAIKNAAVTDPRVEQPYGFTFGYTPDDLVEEDFDNYTGPDGEEYTYAEEEKVLGKYGNDRIVVLSPELYGGRYSNPPFWIRPMQHSGWLDASDAVFGSPTGCKPKIRGALNFDDIESRTKKIANTLSPDPLLSKDQECTSRRPFNHLLLPESHAGLEGVVRTTIRSYACEDFLKGLGVFSNFLYNDRNYDVSVSSLIMNKMKESMMELGTAASSRRIRIKRKNYWYTFLEQSVQVYNRMIEIDGIKPPPSVQKALDDIGELQLHYIDINKKLRTKYFNKDYKWDLPDGEPFFEKGNPNSYDITNLKRFYHDAIAHRIYGDEMFNTDQSQKMDFNNKRFFSLKKIRFFVKIFAIRLVERQCQVVLMELIKSELRIAAGRFNQAASSQAYYEDLEKALLGFKEIFPSSNLTYGTINPGGNVPSVPETNLTSGGSEGSAVFLIEKYVRVTDRENTNGIPSYIRDRGGQFRGVMPLGTFQQFVDSIPSSILTKPDGTSLKVSDCFGNLQFLYEWSIKEIFEYILGPSSQGTYTTSVLYEDLTEKRRLDKLNLLNPDEVRIRFAMENHLTGQEYEDFKVKASEDLIPPDLFEITSIDPVGTTGQLGVSHGLRISVITPKGTIFKKVEASDLLGAISDRASSGNRSGLDVNSLRSGLSSLASIFINSATDIMGATTSIIGDVSGGLNTLGDVLDTAAESSDGLNSQDLDSALRQLATGVGVDIGDIPSVGSWVDPTLTPIPNIEEAIQASALEKAYLFEDGSFSIPLVSAEYSLIDSNLSSFKTNNYDLKCLVDKIVLEPSYNLIFEKLFCTKMTLSMVATYCMFGFTPSQGFGKEERVETDNDAGQADFFDGRHNKKLKQFLRKQFAGYYLSNDVDGQSPDDDDNEDLEFRFSNPFRGLELANVMPKVKWFQKLRIRSNPYDANGVECADPMKDLM